MIAALTGEPAAADVEAILRDQADRSVVSSIGIAEVVDVLVRHRGRPIAEVEERLFWLRVGGLDVMPVDEGIGLRAGSIHAHHYHRQRRPISMADCVTLATALSIGQRLGTADRALLATAVEEGCGVIALPDSQGHRPSVDTQR